MRDINLAYWIRRLLGLLLFLLRRTPHPAMLRHTVVTLDPGTINSAAVAGQPITLPVDGRDVQIVLRPVSLHGSGARLVTDTDGDTTREEDVPRSVSYEGEVTGEEDSDVRLTITPRSVSGYVQLRGTYYWIDPLRQLRRDARPGQFVMYRSHDVLFRVPLASDVQYSGTAEPDEDGDHRVNPHVPIAVWCDVPFEAQAATVGFEWWEAQAAVMNSINGFYKSKVGIEFVIERQVIHRGTSLSSADPSTLLGQFGARVRLVHGDLRLLSRRQERGLELAHLMTGRNMSGDTIGVAWQPGVWSLAEVHYWGIFSPTSRNVLTVGHELGHNFNGDHGLARKICVTHFIWCLDYERTIMWPTVYSDNRREFSAPNDTRVTDNAASGRNVNYGHG